MGENDLDQKQTELEDLYHELENTRNEKNKSIELLQKQCEDNINESREVVDRLQKENVSLADNMESLRNENKDLRKHYDDDTGALRNEIDRTKDQLINERRQFFGRNTNR